MSSMLSTWMRCKGPVSSVFRECGMRQGRCFHGINAKAAPSSATFDGKAHDESTYHRGFSAFRRLLGWRSIFGVGQGWQMLPNSPHCFTRSQGLCQNAGGGGGSAVRPSGGLMKINQKSAASFSGERDSYCMPCNKDSIALDCVSHRGALYEGTMHTL